LSSGTDADEATGPAVVESTGEKEGQEAQGGGGDWERLFRFFVRVSTLVGFVGHRFEEKKGALENKPQDLPSLGSIRMLVCGAVSCYVPVEAKAGGDGAACRERERLWSFFFFVVDEVKSW